MKFKNKYINILILYIVTIKHLKYIQILYRLFYYIKKHKNKYKKIKKSFVFKLSRIDNSGPIFLENGNPQHSKFDKFTFLNKSYFLNEVGWNNKTIDKLWVYNLNYFEYINNDINSVINQKELIINWINNNRNLTDISWESYPLSRRIVNWIKWSLKNNNKYADNEINNSIYFQSEFLYHNVEYHILGNHLISNSKALIFSGLYFSSTRSNAWFSKGIMILEEELRNQILEDGGHFELSPMYQSIIIEDLIDIYSILITYYNDSKFMLLNKLNRIIKRMMVWLKHMVHPDGKISFFNDSAFNNSRTYEELNNYFTEVYNKYINLKVNKIKYLEESGYLIIKNKKITMILDVGKLGPDFLLGHAHADSLSFELSLLNNRVFVNGGTSTYNNNDRRLIERSTSNHNTVTVDNENSSEVWSSFRVAERAYSCLEEIIDNNSNTLIKCSHNGYKKIFKNIIHTRYIDIDESQIVIIDKIINNKKSISNTRLILHPLINLSMKSENEYVLRTKDNDLLVVRVHCGSLVIEDFIYSPEFGKTQTTKCLNITLFNSESYIQLLY